MGTFFVWNQNQLKVGNLKKVEKVASLLVGGGGWVAPEVRGGGEYWVWGVSMLQ